MTLLKYGRRGGAWVEFGVEAIRLAAEGEECALYATNRERAEGEMQRFRSYAQELGFRCELVGRPFLRLKFVDKGSIVWRGPPDSQRAWRGTLMDPFYSEERPFGWEL